MNSHQKTSRRARKLKIRKLAAPRVESLENRCLLTTFTGIGTTTMFDPYGVGNIQLPTLRTSPVYRDANDNLFQVIVGGNIQVELVAAAVEVDTNRVTLRDLVGENELDPIDPAQKAKGADIFAIYIKQADINSVLSITRVTRDGGGKITLEPFSEGAGTLRVSNTAGDPITIDTAANTGKLYLGARTKSIPDVNDSDNIPILQQPMIAPLGIMPAPAGGILYAGVTLVDGQSIGRFLFGGTITGRVVMGGSVNLFYCGQLLTGLTRGTTLSYMPSSVPDNFYVKGDLRDLVVAGPVGTDSGAGRDEPIYITRTEIKVDGRLGQIKSNESLATAVTVLGNQGVSSITQPQTELEARSADAALYVDQTFPRGFLRNDAFNNDSFNTAQYLGTINSATLGVANIAQVRGTLAATNKIADFADYYGVALMAGQTVEVRLYDLMLEQLKAMAPGSPASPYLNVGVFDPDGRLIATDYTDVDRSYTTGQPFRFTSQRPGVYRFAVGLYRETVWAGTAATSTLRSIFAYELRVSNAGNIALGGIVATNNILDYNRGRNGFDLQKGDFGAVAAGGVLLGLSKMPPMDLTAMTPVNVQVLAGDLRTVEGGTIGILANNAIGMGANLHVPLGSVGLVRSTTGELGLNGQYMTSLYLPDPSAPPLTMPLPIVGKDYQMIDAFTTFTGKIVCNQKVGVIKAADMSNAPTIVIIVNADRVGNDGIIDLIDVTGDLGSYLTAGPQITTGPQGNVRYMNVGGTVYRDVLFGTGQPTNTIYQPGEAVTLNDDSGATITISPAGPTGVLDITAYGIRGSGGVAVIRVNATSSISIVGDPQSVLAGAEIGAVNISPANPGQNLIPDFTGKLVLDPTYLPLNVDISGKGRVDVFNIVGTRFSRIVNSTPGEIVNILAETVGVLEAETLGVPTRSTPCALIPQATLVGGFVANPANYPFDQQHNAIIAADFASVSARGALGNIIASPAVVLSVVQAYFKAYEPALNLADNFGTIQLLVANADSKLSTTTFDGIVAPIYASGPLPDVNFGAGLTTSGTGNGALSGLFAVGPIGSVQGARGADIRGNIVSTTSIDYIRLVGGSIINAGIMACASLDQAREIAPIREAFDSGDSYTNPIYEINYISIESGSTTPVTGGTTPAATTSKKKKRVRVNLRTRQKKSKTPVPPVPPTPAPAPLLPGGIIGSYFGAGDIGTIKVKGGFGILNSTVTTRGDGVIERLETDGYGIRDCNIIAGMRAGSLIANGDGKSVKTTAFSPSVRISENKPNPSTLILPNRLTDLYKLLDISTKTPSVQGATNTGVIAGNAASALRDLDLVQCNRLGNYTPAVPPPPALPIPVRPSTFNFANSIKKINVATDIANVNIVTGSINLFSAGRDFLTVNATVAGRITSLYVKRDFDATSLVQATGPDGSVNSIYVGRNFAGTIIAQRYIGTIKVLGTFTGSILENGKPRKPGR